MFRNPHLIVLVWINPSDIKYRKNIEKNTFWKSKNVLSHLRFYLEDDDHKPVVCNGEAITFIIQYSETEVAASFSEVGFTRPNWIWICGCLKENWRTVTFNNLKMCNAYWSHSDKTTRNAKSHTNSRAGDLRKYTS